MSQIEDRLAALGIVLPLTSTLFAQSASASASLLGH